MAATFERRSDHRKCRYPAEITIFAQYFMDAPHFSSCHLGPGISPEHFIPEHFFLFMLNGTMTAYDGVKTYEVKTGECCIARRNYLVRYNKSSVEGEFSKIVVVLDMPFLKQFQEKHGLKATGNVADVPILPVPTNELLTNYVQSLKPYYDNADRIDSTFADLKREELLLILLRINPGLAGVFFNYGDPEKIDLESFMIANFRFNVSLERFAYMTGRSLSSFKRDFQRIFNESPGQWLTRKRLEDAHFQIQYGNKAPGDVYLDAGFENFSHFSHAFKKKFGVSPSNVPKA